MDGPTPEKKRKTRDERESRRTSSLAKANTLLLEMEVHLQSGRKLRKQHFRKLSKFINGAFYLTANLRAELARHLRKEGWTVIECPSEADIQIALDCQAHDIVISADSDSLIHSSIKTIWWPARNRGTYLEYRVAELLEQLELSRTGLTALGIISKNDYACNVKRMGLKGNYSLIRTMEMNSKFPLAFGESLYSPKKKLI